MNFRGISFYLSFFCYPISLLTLINILYSYYFDYFLSISNYFTTFIISSSLGLFLFFLGKKAEKKINFIEQLILVTVVYFIAGFIISIPFYLSNFQFTFQRLQVNFRPHWHRFSTNKTPNISININSLALICSGSAAYVF